jgi:hypothetical protein
MYWGADHPQGHQRTDGKAELLEVVDALSPAGRLARRLDRGEQECDQDRNDCDHDQELHQREAASSLPNRRAFLFRYPGSETHDDKP